MPSSRATAAVQPSPPEAPDAGPARLLVSVVVPVLNEAPAIGPFLARMRPVLDRLDCDAEILFVDDGSTDGTGALVAGLAVEDDRIRLVGLSRNFGKDAALTAGIDHARGDAVVLIDVDLQDPPELVAEFVARWRAGTPMVYGVRSDRSTDSWTKRSTAGAFYRVFNRFSRQKLPTNAGDFRLIDRRIADVLRAMPERHRFSKGLFAWIGFPSVGVPYVRERRSQGHSRFSYWRLWNFALDGLVGFSTAPLRLWTYVGLIIALLAVIYGVVIIGHVLLLGRDVPGYASMLCAVLFLGGVQLVSLGIIGEYIGRLFVEVKQRPIYIVDRMTPDPAGRGRDGQDV